MQKSLLLLILSLSVLITYGQGWTSCGATPGKLSGTVQDILLNESTPDPIYSVTPSPVLSIPHHDFLVVLHDSLAYDSLGGTIIHTKSDGLIVPNELGLVVGDTFSLVSFSYDLEQIKKLTHGLLKDGNYFVGTCCSVVENVFPDLGFCSALNSIGITDSSDVNNLEDVLKVVSVFTYGSVKPMSIRGLNNGFVKINSRMSSFHVVSCSNGVTEICFAFDSLSSSHDQYRVSTPCTVNIPDANFKAYLVGNTAINTNGDTEIQCSEASAFSGQINCSSLSISDLTGIEEFTALTYLNCSRNQLTSLDLSNNKDINYLSCSINQLTSLDISQNTLLETLGCGNNQLKNLDVSNNLKLTDLHIYQNEILDMDVSHLTKLTYLNCVQNSLISLNIANGNNSNFTGLDANNNPDLTCIQVDDSTYSKTNWTNIDATASFSVNCGGTPCTVTIPDANFKAYLVGNTAINTNEDTEIQCSEASAFTGDIYCPSLSISDLTGIEAFTALTNLYCFDNQLTSLDVSANTALIGLKCSDNQLTNLDVSFNIELTSLNCQNNQLTSLDVSSNTALVKLRCYVNPLSNLDVSSNTVLTELYCGDNQLTSLDVSFNTALTVLDCQYNQLTSLDMSANTALTELICEVNQLTSLDVSSNIELTSLNCGENQLTSLDVANGNNTNYTYFTSEINPDLTCIQVDDTTYSTTNWTNIDATASFSVNCAEPNGVFSEQNHQALSIFPNPTSDIINTEEGTLEIADFTGNLVLSTESNGKVDVSGLESGVYLVTQYGMRTKPIIV